MIHQVNTRYLILLGLVIAMTAGGAVSGQTTPVASPTAENHDICPEMVKIPEGSFQMGSPKSDTDSRPWERPQQTVHIKSFSMGKTEVTQKQWMAVMGVGNNPSKFKACGEDCPVERVSWKDMQTYIKKLNLLPECKPGKPYRLPSEAEWEYAARGNTNTKYWWGDTASHDYANYGKDECCSGLAQGKDKWENTAPVAQFKANPFGLYDMHGNVWEWVQDVWHDDYTDAPTNGSAWLSGGDQAGRVLRGGSWGSDPGNLRSALRNRITADNCDNYAGFRLARALLTP